MVWYPDFDIVDDVHIVTMDEMGEPVWPLIGGGREKIESALAVPATYACYENADLFRQAAYLLGRLAAAHGYENGNKRTALAVTELFLARNGYILSAEMVIQRLIVAVVRANADQDDPASRCDELAAALRDRVTLVTRFPG